MAHVLGCTKGEASQLKPFDDWAYFHIKFQISLVKVRPVSNRWQIIQSIW